MPLRGKFGRFFCFVQRHRLQSVYGNIDYGYETDLGVSRRQRKGLTASLQVARYRDDSDPLNVGPNTGKVWRTPGLGSAPELVVIAPDARAQSLHGGR
jgi:hypothetical protein